MLNLFLKDVLIQRKTFLFAVIFYPLLALISFQGLDDGAPFVFGSFFIAYILVFNAFIYDEKYKGDVFINSLPIKRSEVVKARYMTMFIFTLIGIGVMLIYMYGARLLNININMETISVSKLILNFFGIVIIYAIYFPVLFKYGYTKTRFISTFLFIFLAFGMSFISGFITKDTNISIITYVQNSPEWVVSTIALLVMAISIIISINISIRFYENKEY